VVLFLLLVAGGLAACVAAARDVGPGWLADAGAVTISTTYAWALAVRTGGRPVLFGGLALLLGGGVATYDADLFRTGAAVLTSVVTAVLAVMATVPAVHFRGVVRNVVLALLLSAAGAVGTVSWAPVVSLDRFEYTALGLGVASAFIVVFRLGAGLHGLGTRGVLAVIGGSALLAVTLGYAELLRRYATPGLTDGIFAFVRWCHHHIGAFPRPIEALLGFPAIAWGTHMRARRRQGWWVCAFGVCATSPVTYALVDPHRDLTEVTLSSVYAAVVGLVVGFVVIRADLWLTGTRGRRVFAEEEASAVRPEPGRTRALH
jgi:hypothetical protein